ncbi:MAG: Pls/PosA family non-ribosomal peptide synthetase, partial [Pseudonocardia sediminis]
MSAPPVPRPDIDRDVGAATGSETERALGAVLAEILDLGHVPADAHFFDDLGADSMVLARFCARLRKREDLPSPSMRDVYAHPTVRGLAGAVAPVTAPPAPPLDTPAPDVPSPDGAAPDASPVPDAGGPEPAATASTPGRARYVLCGAAQLLIFLGYLCGVAVVTTRVYGWVAAGAGMLDLYLRAVVAGGAGLLALCLLPIVAKWVLIGRWKARSFPVWGLTYLRFWLVKTLVRANPLVLVAGGSALQVLYLRALGARIGPGVTLLTRSVPVATDLLTIGAGTVVRKSVLLSGYRAHAGRIEIGPVTLGRDVFIGETTVVDIGTSMGDGAGLGHSSSLHTGQEVPAGQTWHGSPARRADVDYRTVAPVRCGPLRRGLYAAGQMLWALLFFVPLLTGGLDLLLADLPRTGIPLFNAALDPTGWVFWAEAAATTSGLLFGGLLVGLVVVKVVPAMLNRLITPEKIYPLYGFHFSVHRWIVRLTNVKFFTFLFGDSSYIVGYLKYIGYDLGKVEQTGSNFGTAVVHETPFLASVGSGTMVADGLSLMNAEYSSSSFRLCRTSIGGANFLGNRITYPAGGRTGDDCLLATKVMIPVDGPVRSGVGLLGSPPFEIPRTVARDADMDTLSADGLARRLAAKNRHNRHTIALALGVRWLHLFGVVLLAMAAADLFRSLGALAVAAQMLTLVLFSLVFFVLVERASTGFRPLRPLFCSIYDERFWRHERFWKLVLQGLDRTLVGTPFKNVLSRALGTRVGARVFDDGCAVPERTLVSIGDGATLNAGTVIQCHSQEDGAFKSDRTTLGDRVTLGVGAFVHYGVTIGDDVLLEADSFLMKGEEIPAGAHWAGNPAQEHSAEPVRVTTGVSTAPAPVPAPVAATAPAPAPGQVPALRPPPAALPRPAVARPDLTRPAPIRPAPIRPAPIRLRPASPAPASPAPASPAP